MTELRDHCVMVTATCGVCSGTEQDEQGSRCEVCAGVADETFVACARSTCGNYRPDMFPPVHINPAA